MTKLSDLPSELLFQIIHLVLSVPHPILPDGQRHRQNFTGRNRNVICVPSAGISGSPDALNLLLTSQRLYSETILYLSKTPQSVKLDVAIVDVHWIWPTLRKIPIRGNSNIVDMVEIELILCCTEEKRYLQVEYGISEMSTGELVLFGLGEMCAKELVSLLRHFVFEKPFVTRINTLKFNIDTTRYGDGNKVLSSEEVPFRRIEGLAHLDFDALYPVDEQPSLAFYRWLWIRTGLAYPESLSQSIGKTMLCVNGKMLEEVTYSL